MSRLPTSEAYAELQDAYDHFNAELFAGELPPCLITLQRERRTYGYFSHGRFAQTQTGELVDEIAMNPGYFAVCPIEETLSTLVHEMVHQWQHHHGKPGRRGYHNREWGDKMEAIGLMPSDTGEPGGKRTGEQMMDYIIEGGAFDLACAALLTREYRLSWVDRFPCALPRGGGQGSAPALAPPSPGEAAPVPAPAAQGASWLVYPDTDKPAAGRSNRLKYRCPSCGAQAWGKPALRLLCGEDDCQAAPMLPAD